MDRTEAEFELCKAETKARESRLNNLGERRLCARLRRNYEEEKVAERSAKEVADIKAEYLLKIAEIELEVQKILTAYNQVV